jgi:hypothetical protein
MARYGPTWAPRDSIEVTGETAIVFINRVGVLAIVASAPRSECLFEATRDGLRISPSPSLMLVAFYVRSAVAPMRVSRLVEHRASWATSEFLRHWVGPNPKGDPRVLQATVSQPLEMALPARRDQFGGV